MITYKVVGENDEGEKWTEGNFLLKEDALKLLKELEDEGPHPYCEFYLKEVVIN